MIAPRGRHALEAVALVASAPPHSPVTIAVVAAHIGMSMSYTENLLKMLKLCGILHSVRGPGGGYQMGPPLAGLSAWDVIQGVEGVQGVQGLGDAGSAAGGDSLPLRAESGAGDASMVACLDALEARYSALCSDFLRSFPLSQLVDETVLAAPTEATPARHRGLRPLPKPQRPRAPTSVFEWSAFMGSLAA